MLDFDPECQAKVEEELFAVVYYRLKKAILRGKNMAALFYKYRSIYEYEKEFVSSTIVLLGEFGISNQLKSKHVVHDILLGPDNQVSVHMINCCAQECKASFFKCPLSLDSYEALFRPNQKELSIVRQLYIHNPLDSTWPNCASSIQISLYVEQWFSTFFSSRHTKHEKKFGGTLIPEIF